MKKLLNLAIKLVSHPSEGLSEIIEEKPIIPAVILFVISNLIVAFLFWSLILIKDYRLQSTILNVGFILKILAPKLLLPFLSIFLIHFLSKYIYKSEGNLLTFLTCYLFIIGVIVIIISCITLLFYAIFLFSGNPSLTSPYNFIAKVVQGGWSLILTIAAIMGVYGLSGRQALTVWFIQFLPMVILYYFKLI